MYNCCPIRGHWKPRPRHNQIRAGKITLTEKLDTLWHLDEEILEQVEDDELDDEIEQADVCRERIQAAIIDATQWCN